MLTEVREEVSITASTLGIVADILVLTCTWIKTYHHFREARELRVHINTTTVLLADGTLTSRDRRIAISHAYQQVASIFCRSSSAVIGVKSA